jgi:hypothetical protein
MEHLAESVVTMARPFVMMRCPEVASQSKDRLRVILENLSMLQRGFSLDRSLGSAAQEHCRAIVKDIVRETRDLCVDLSLPTVRAESTMATLDSDDFGNLAGSLQELVRHTRQHLTLRPM